MTDIKKVIGLLQEAAEYFRKCRSNTSFASKEENHFWELQNAMNEAIEVLKEQRAEQPIVHENSYGWKFYYCPKCKQEFYQIRKQAYCDKCGKAVKWVDSER